jgi:hypothetical protein
LTALAWRIGVSVGVARCVQKASVRKDHPMQDATWNDGKTPLAPKQPQQPEPQQRRISPVLDRLDDIDFDLDYELTLDPVDYDAE